MCCKGWSGAVVPCSNQAEVITGMKYSSMKWGTLVHHESFSPHAIQCIKTHGCVSAAKKAVWHTSVLFTGTANSLFSTLHISITTGLISIKFTYFMPSIYATLHTKFKRNWPSSTQDIFLKIAPFSSPFSSYSSLHRFTKVTLSQPKTPFLGIDFFQIWHTYKALCGLS